MNFVELGISKELIEALSKQKISTPTNIQAETYKHIMSGKDIIGSSETGSGKTLAYLLPMYAKIKSDEKGVQVLIIVPTQELAMQIHKQVQLLSTNSNMSVMSAVAIGDGNINRQIEALKAKPQIVIGTCGRILQLIKVKKLSVHTVQTLIIDEADKMLDKTNIESLKEIRKSLMKFTQVVMFSASMDNKSIKTSELINKEPIIIRSNEKAEIPSSIKHLFVIVDRRERIETLRRIAQSLKPEKAIVFINTTFDLEESTQKLKYHHYNAENIHGENSKIDRKNVINAFKSGKLQYLIATDIAARGLQIDGISTVINVNLPEDSKEYLHRAGRCGRNGQQGVCVSIITENELPKIKSFQKEFNISIVEKRLYEGKLVSK